MSDIDQPLLFSYLLLIMAMVALVGFHTVTELPEQIVWVALATVGIIGGIYGLYKSWVSESEASAA